MVRANRRSRLQRYRRALLRFWGTALAAELEYGANAFQTMTALRGHGFGLGREGKDSTQWPRDLLIWLKQIGVL